ncbi:MAG: SipW-dependent-type signal peptide-containing protein [Clostridia bacterium]|nr:SipW-dependent-type signal peptide-containing protein [Clostridia bacterium]
MNKRRILILAIVVMLAAILATGTAAYFTAEDKAHTVVASGNVKIAVNEWADLEKTKEFEAGSTKKIIPGQEVVKVVEVENIGSSEAWVRVKADVAIQMKDDSAKLDTGLIHLDIDTENWTEKDGWYYYKTALKAGETCKPLFTKVSFDSGIDSAYSGCTMTVSIQAHAVQTANNGASVLEAKGWPAE